ncbi:TadE/TadG family type IV pilus assembly protein [Pasteurella canis]|uniref:TadE/TadG family type IV pilus assembly protein n=1 Tax=Pasteurella canis TaxID=753 RepID=UPI0013291218|nr:TadE/TadG family type IV pilus assembly protein [Pasteurella canis]MXN87881.1 pilus assembly protein [Pasteurella canis]
MKKLNLTFCFYEKLKQFYADQRGVYTVMTALLAFPVLVLIGFTVDGTGVLLDKARLAQGMDQAALALIAENNEYRENKKHSDVNRQMISKAEKDKFRGNEFMAKQEKRNQELIQGIAKLYLRSEDSGDPDAPVKVTKDFQYLCEELDLPTGNEYSRRKPVVCQVQGSVDRKFWLPVSESLANVNSLKNGRLTLDSQTTYAIKEKGVVIPVELMLVADFSGSMHQDLNGRYSSDKTKMGKSKISILREVVGEISKILLPLKVSEEVSPFNRMAFTTFSGGVRQKNESSKCTLPYERKSWKNSINLTVERWITGNNVRKQWNQQKGQWEDSWVKFDVHYKGKYDKFYENTCTKASRNSPMRCQILANPKTIMDYAMEIQDWTTVRAIFYAYMDTNRTINQVQSFDGSNRKYHLVFDNENYCLGGNTGKETTQAWFDQSNKNISQALSRINPQGWTSASSGLIVGANLIMDANKDPKSQPAKLGTNTQRVIMVLSDGEDNWPTYDTLVSLLNAGICDRIKERVDTLQDPKFRELPTRIAFVAFGYSPPKRQVDAWKKCVGDQYYVAYSQKELLDTFKQVIGFEEEVGRSSSKKPKFN